MTTRQLTLDFPHRPALGLSDYFISDCNALAVQWIDRWPDWPSPALVVHGPAGSGKTHLAHVWRARSDAILRSADDIAGREPGVILAGANTCVLDGIDETIDPHALLHLYNSLSEAGGHLLITTRSPPARWSLSLADLASRLSAAAAVDVAPPDDALLGALLVKLFHDRQLRVGEEVLSYLLARMERTFAAAETLVAALDARALAEKRGVTVPLTREVLQAAEAG